MTIHELRKLIHVYNFTSHNEGCLIDYIMNNKTKSLQLNNIQMFSELTKTGSIDEDIHTEEWADYQLNQWDALNIVIRHEYACLLETDANILSIDKSISKITNK